MKAVRHRRLPGFDAGFAGKLAAVSAAFWLGVWVASGELNSRSLLAVTLGAGLVFVCGGWTPRPEPDLRWVGLPKKPANRNGRPNDSIYPPR